MSLKVKLKIVEGSYPDVPNPFAALMFQLHPSGPYVGPFQSPRDKDPSIYVFCCTVIIRPSDRQTEVSMARLPGHERLVNRWRTSADPTNGSLGLAC